MKMSGVPGAKSGKIPVIKIRKITQQLEGMNIKRKEGN